jgi:hypothetical protein
MRFTAQQIATFAKNVGFSGADLKTAVAVCYGESSFNPGEYNPETAAGAPAGKGSVGLWQIYQNAHPEFAGWNLSDPQVNACAARIVWMRSGWNAWASYKLKTTGYQNGLVQAASIDA